MIHKQGRNLRSRHEGFLFCFCMVSVCLFVFISFHRKSSWQNKQKQQWYTEGRKCICIKHFFSASKIIIERTFKLATVKIFQWNRAKPPEVKYNTYNFSKPTVKVRSIATFILTNVGNRSYSVQGQILSETDTTLRGVTFY